MNVIQAEIIEKMARRLVEKDTGCDSMFKHQKFAELALMYRVFKRVETTLLFVIEKMQNYIEDCGQKIVKDDALVKNPIEFTSKLLTFKKEIDDLIEKSFKNDIIFQKARDDSFQNFMNEQNMTPYYIAAYCDNEFKKGLKGIPDVEVNQRLDSIVRLFCCLHGRDIFIRAYSKHLASRLINKTFTSLDAEELMLQKLRVECGHNTVNKLASMFNDITLSKITMEEFKDNQLNKQIQSMGIDFSTEVLTNGHWPDQQEATCTLQGELKNVTRMFEQFYKIKYPSRSIRWLLMHGTAEIKPVVYPSKPYIFIVNTYQANILLLFNSYDELTYSQIQQMTNIPENQLNPALIYLCNPKNTVIQKEIKKPEFAPDEKMKIAKVFQNPNIKVVLTPASTQKKKEGGEND